MLVLPIGKHMGINWNIVYAGLAYRETHWGINWNIVYAGLAYRETHWGINWNIVYAGLAYRKTHGHQLEYSVCWSCL